MAKTVKISVTVDQATLDEVKRLEGKDLDLSAIFHDALTSLLHRHRMLALLDELERENPSSPEDRAAGERLWQKMQASRLHRVE